MKRREFLTLIGGDTTWPVLVRAQTAKRLLTVGFLAGNATVWRPWTAAFVTRLGELGWTEGQTIKIDYGWWEGNIERAADIAAEFVHQNVDVIVVNADAVPAVKKATTTIPTVFVLSQDPVGSGLVTNLAHPEANITGLSIQSTDLAGKRFEILRETIPRLRRMAIMANLGISQAAVELQQVQALATPLGIELQSLDIRRGEDIASAFERLQSGSQALYVVVDALIAVNRSRIVTFALGARLPTMFNNRVHAEAGGLMSYGPNFSDQYRRAAELVDKTTAKAIGLSIPPNILARADEVIE